MRLNVRSLIAPVLAAVLAASLSQAAVYQWSKTPASNAGADPTINWAEGMAPSAINDSARAMMAAVAQWRDDTSGLLVTTGTSTSYVLTSNQGLPSTPTDGQLIAFTPNVTNGLNAVISIDGGSGFAFFVAPGTYAPAGTLVAGTPYTAKYSASNTAWMLRNFYGNPFTVPLGAVIDYFGSSAPNSNFALPVGQCISRSTYSGLFSLVSTTFGSCDGTTTFALPDLRGRGTLAASNMGGSDSGRLSSTYFGTDPTVIGAGGGNQAHTLNNNEIPVITPSGSVASSVTGGTVGGTGSSVNTPNGSGVYPTGAATITVTSTFTGAQFNSGGGQPHSILPPAMIVYKIMRIL